MQLLSILFFGLSQYQSEAVRKPPKLRCIWLKVEGGPFCFFFFLFFCGRFWNYFWVPGSMLSCFSASLSASLLVCFSALPASFLFCFFAFPASLLFCFCASVPFYFYYSTFSFLQSCVFAALLPAPLLLCFLSLQPFCFFFSFALFSPVCKHPRWNPKKP